MGIKAFLYSALFLVPIVAQSQTYTFECVAGGRLSGDSCDICPNTIVESRSFNGLVIYRDSSFYRWIDQPYSIRIKPGGIIEYWEHAVSPYNERVTIPLDLTGFATIEGMADSTWCNSPGPHRYQELHFDSIGVDFARVRITGSNTGFALRGGSGIDFGFDSDTLDIESTGGGAGLDTLVAIAPAAGFTIAGSPAQNPRDTLTFALANDLAALEALSSTGILARTAAETYQTRTITAGTGAITITNGNGVGGNPTINNTDPDQSTTNEIQTYAHTGTTSYTNTLSNGGGAFTLQAGAGMTLSHTAGTTTFASSITQYTDENAQDAVGGILVDGTTIDLTYNDGTPSITAEVIDNSISNAKIRQSAGLSVIGRSANSTGNVADITAAADGNVLRRSGTTLGFGTVATAGIADEAVTYAKIQNVAANNVLLGNDNGAGSDIQELSVAEVQTMLGFVDGTGANQRVTYWTDANTVSGEAAFLYDAANDRLTINCTDPGLGAGAAILNLANVGSDDTGEFIRMAGNIDGNMLAGMYNSSTTADDNTIFTVSQAGNSAGDPVLQLQVSGSGGNTTSLGVDNSDANKFKITPNGNLPGANANASLVGTNDSPPKWGVNKDAPGFTFDVGGMARDEMYHGINVSWGSGDVSFGLGAGTSPTFTSMTGTHNYVRLQFSTGTSPTANNAIFTVTRKSGYEFATKGFTVICAGNANTANEITKFYMNTDNGVQYTITANGTLTASTEYVLYMTSSGY